jgi:hypothetical protein
MRSSSVIAAVVGSWTAASDHAASRSQSDSGKFSSRQIMRTEYALPMSEASARPAASTRSTSSSTSVRACGRRVSM